MLEISISLAVVCFDPLFKNQSETMAANLTSPYLLLPMAEEYAKFDWILFYKEGCLCLQSNKHSQYQEFHIDYLSMPLKRRLQQGRATKDLLYKALGIKIGKKRPRILDATLGLGIDTLVLAGHADSIVSCERSPILYYMVGDAMMRAAEDAIFQERVKKTKIMLSDAKQVLDQSTESFDVIYLDPMYPERNKKAGKKKELFFLRELVGKDEDFLELFQKATERSNCRVIVKRPLYAQKLKTSKGLLPTFDVKGKMVRLDVYVA